MADRNTRIRGTQIFDDTIEPSKLKALNSPLAGYILEYDNATSQFKWIAGAEAVTETPSGLVNGSNKVFTLSNTPESGALSIYLNGLYQEEGSGKDYVISGSDITFVDAPQTEDIIVASYYKIEGTSPGDMAKSVYDTDNDGIVDKAETIDDGAGNSANASDVKSAVDDSHTHANSAQLDLVSDGDHDVVTSGNPHSVSKSDVGLANVPNIDPKVSSIEFMIDGGGSAIVTGIAGYVEIPFACTITQVSLLADQTGSIKVDIWKDSYANYAPTDADTITGGNEPEISSGVKDQDGTLTSWTTSISAGDILIFNVDSIATIEKCLVSLKVERT